MNELKRIIRRPVYWFLLVVAPMLCSVFFLTMMGEGLPEKLPVGMVDEDGTSTSRNLLRNLDAFQMMDVEGRYASVSEAREAVQRGDIYAFYYIPRGTTRKVMRGEVPTVSFYANYSYLVAGSLSYRDMRMLSELASGAATRSVLLARGATEDAAMAYLRPIVVECQADGNPWLNYSQYLSCILLPGLLMMFILFATTYSLGEEIKMRPAPRVITYRGLLAKMWPYTVVFFLQGLLLLALLHGVCDFPCRVGIAPMMGLMLLFVLASQGLGLFFFALIPTPRLSLSAASLWSVLSFSICGMSFPVMAMHPMLQSLSVLFPLRHYFLLYVTGALHGLPLTFTATSLAALAGFMLLPLLTGWRLKRVLQKMPYVP